MCFRRAKSGRRMGIGIFLSLALVLAVALVSFSCGNGSEGRTRADVAGRYISETNTEDYLDLGLNGTFHLEEEGESVSGTWEVEGNKVTLTWSGYSSTGTIQGNTITDNEGKRWVRE